MAKSLKTTSFWWEGTKNGLNRAIQRELAGSSGCWSDRWFTQFDAGPTLGRTAQPIKPNQNDNRLVWFGLKPWLEGSFHWLMDFYIRGWHLTNPLAFGTGLKFWALNLVTDLVTLDIGPWAFCIGPKAYSITLDLVYWTNGWQSLIFLNPQYTFCEFRLSIFVFNSNSYQFV